MSRPIAALMLVAALAFAACGGGGAHPDVTAPRAPASVAAGAELYQVHCARCHGAELEGGAGPALPAATESQSDEQITSQVVRGRGRMPAFGTLLTEGDIASIIDFLRTVQAGSAGG